MKLIRMQVAPIPEGRKKESLPQSRNQDIQKIAPISARGKYGDNVVKMRTEDRRDAYKREPTADYSSYSQPRVSAPPPLSA